MYAEIGQVNAAAKAAGIHRCTHYRKLATDAKYREAFEQAEHEVSQELEDEAVRRALFGTKHPVTYKGKLVRVGRRILYRVTYSDSLLIALLKRFRPQLYGEHVRADVTGSVPVDLAERIADGRKRVLAMRAAAS
jgi:hypothetical protein